MEAKKHIDLIDILKGVAIISVLICHSVIVYPVNLEEVAWCNILKRFVDSYQMPLFFMISGFLMFRNFTWDKLWSKYQTRFHSVLIPYLIISESNRLK